MKQTITWWCESGQTFFRRFVYSSKGDNNWHLEKAQNRGRRELRGSNLSVRQSRHYPIEFICPPSLWCHLVSSSDRQLVKWLRRRFIDGALQWPRLTSSEVPAVCVVPRFNIGGSCWLWFTVNKLYTFRVPTVWLVSRWNIGNEIFCTPFGRSGSGRILAAIGWNCVLSTADVIVNWHAIEVRIHLVRLKEWDEADSMYAFRRSIYPRKEQNYDNFRDSALCSVSYFRGFHLVSEHQAAIWYPPG